MDYLLAANDGLKILVGVSILFVWVVRYHNIVEEFKLYHLPDWLRDLVGILKITFANGKTKEYMFFDENYEILKKYIKEY